MRKALVTLNIGNYLPEITRLTYPFFKIYSNKIKADFIEITERQWPHIPIPNYEKFQLHEISGNYDYTYFIDCDAWISPDTPDWAELVGDKSVVLFNGVDNRLDRFSASNYSRRSGSRIGACTWNVICSDWTGPDLWTPPDDFESACNEISLLWCEAKTGNCKRDHLIDDYQLSENIARYGLKVQTINGILEKMNRAPNHYCHLYNCPAHEKLVAIRARLDQEGISYP